MCEYRKEEKPKREMMNGRMRVAINTVLIFGKYQMLGYQAAHSSKRETRITEVTRLSLRNDLPIRFDDP